MLPLGDVIRKYGLNFHSYADDKQLYLSCKPSYDKRVSPIQQCIASFQQWMAKNMLKLNSDKTVELVSGPKYSLLRMSWHIF